jgi:type IV secretory pathway TraG/TraD family ATPase VirD4
LEGQRFWDAQGRIMMAPMLWAAINTGQGLGDAAQWVSDPKLEDRVSTILGKLGDRQAMNHWFTFRQLPADTKGSVLGTAASVLEVWGLAPIRDMTNTHADDPARPVFHIDEFLTSGRGTVYLVAPIDHPEMYTAFFETFTNAITAAVSALSARNHNLPMDPPLLLAIDEAANVAPLKNLDKLVSTVRKTGEVIVTVWQDDGQVDALYGAQRARTIRSNHRYTVYFPGWIRDRDTLERISKEIGDDVRQTRSTTTGTGADGRGSVTIAERVERVAPPEWLQRRPASEVIVTGSRIAPMRLTAPGWWEDKTMTALINPEVAAAFTARYTTSRRRKAQR